MKIMLLIVALVIVALAGVLAWFVIGRLSSDAIAMAIGLAIGVFSLFPAGWALSLGRARDAEDDYAGQDYIDVQPIYRVMQLPALPERRAEIANIRAALDYIEARDTHEPVTR